ncbi:unnamed protein product, partial [Amoebophrya sp. A120]
KIFQTSSLTLVGIERIVHRTHQKINRWRKLEYRFEDNQTIS